MLDPLSAYPGVLQRLDKVSPLRGRGFRYFRCPHHDDHSPSAFAFVHPQSGMLVLACRCGCPMTGIMRSIGVGRKDVNPDTKAKLKWVRHAHYDYRNERGDILLRVVRLHGLDESGVRVTKRFVHQSPKPDGGWFDHSDGVERPLYRLPELVATPRNRLLWLVEGEGKCDGLRDLGLCATTLCGGSNGRVADADRPHLAGRRIVACVDNDDDGEKWVANLLSATLTRQPSPESVRVVRFPELPRHGDVDDWVARLRSDGRSENGVRGALAGRAQAQPVIVVKA